MSDHHDMMPSNPAQGDPDRHVLLRQILEQGYRFDFFQAVWLVERLSGTTAPVGHRGPVTDESLRFRPSINLGFPATDIEQVRLEQSPMSDVEKYLMDVTFMGIYGVSTPLPLHYAFDMYREVQHARSPSSPLAGGRAVDDDEDTTSSSGGNETSPGREFLDVFHHRLISLFYRAWLKYRYHLQYGLKGRDRISDYMLWLIGLSPDLSYSDCGVSPTRMIRYAGALQQRPRSAPMLEGILRDYWPGIPIDIEQCVGRWVTIPQADTNCLGACNSTLGIDLTLGEEVFDLNGQFNVVVGPVSWTVYEAFLPDGPAFSETTSIIRMFCTDPLSFTLEIKLEPDAVPDLKLGTGSAAGRLGYTSWALTDDIGETSIKLDGDATATVGMADEDMPGETPGGVLAAF